MFNLDGKWFVTACVDKTARVWDAQDGYPLTPPMRHLTELTSAFFAAHDDEVITIDTNNISRVWKLAIDERPVADLVSLSHLLAGFPPGRFGSGESPQVDTLEALWQRLRVKYPETFETSESEIERWHEFQAQECETNHQWFAAVFHLKILAAGQPHDQTLARRLDDAKQALTSNH